MRELLVDVFLENSIFFSSVKMVIFKNPKMFFGKPCKRAYFI